MACSTHKGEPYGELVCIADLSNPYRHGNYWIRIEPVVYRTSSRGNLRQHHWTSNDPSRKDFCRIGE